jgi:hypothetical protein
MLPVLLDGVDRGTQEALRSKSYTLANGKVLKLSQYCCVNPVVRWLGKENAAWLPNSVLADRQSDNTQLKFWPMEEVEVALTLADQRKGVRAGPLAISIEATQFCDNGTQLNLKPSINVIECTLALQSDFREYASLAPQGLNGRCSLRDHLTAAEDPYVFVCSGVTVFRGQSSNGFPFLDMPFTADVVVSARSFRQARIAASTNKTEFFEDPIHYHALLDRLDLIALAAMEQSQDLHTSVVGPLPSLVLGIRPAIYPKHALAMALKHWRHKYAGSFADIVIACGTGSTSEKLARDLDAIVNDATIPVPSALVTSEKHHRQSLAMQGDAIREALEFARAGASRQMENHSSGTRSQSKQSASGIRSLSNSEHHGRLRRHSHHDEGHREGVAELRSAAREMLMARRGSRDAEDLAAKVEELRHRNRDAEQTPKASARDKNTPRFSGSILMSRRSKAEC